MQQQTEAEDDSTELRIADDASDKAQIEGERVYEAVNCDVTVQSKGFQDRNAIVAYWNDDEMNGYTKARVINKVMQSPASVELITTKDGKTAVEFVAQ